MKNITCTEKDKILKLMAFYGI